MNDIAKKYSEYNFEQLKNETIDIIKTGLRKLKKSPANNIININSSNYIPKLLLIGSKDSGKNTIVETLSSSSAKIFTKNDHECKVILNDEQVIFNIPEELATNDQAITHWQEIFKTFTKNNSKNPFDGIILTLNLHQLIHVPKAAKFKFNLHLHNILHLGSNILKRKIPIYILITNINTLIGFNEFFKDPTYEDLDNIWGLELTNIDDPNLLDGEITNSFKKMQNKLEKRLYWKLNTLISPTDISLAYEFPLQFDSIQHFIINNLKQIFSVNIFSKFNIAGLFFISNEQTQGETDCISQYTRKILSNNLCQENLSYKNNSTNLFAKNLLLDTIPKQTKSYFPQPKIFIKKISTKIFSHSLSIFFLILILSSIYIYQTDIANINKINNNLIDYRVQLQKILKKDYNLQELVDLLNLLVNIDEQFSNLNIEKISQNILPDNFRIRKNLTKLHLTTRHKILLPFIKKQTEEHLKLKLKENNPSRAFIILKTYSMLGTSVNFDSEFLVSKLLFILGNNPFLETNDIHQLEPLIRQSLIKSPLLTLNQELISKTNKLLTSKPVVNLVHDIFKEYVNDNPIKNVGLYSESLFVPDYVKSTNFVNYFQNLIPELSKDFSEFYHNADLPQFNVEHLIQSVQYQYIQEYVSYWKKYISSLLPKIQINTTDSIEQALHRLYTSMLYLDTAIKLIKENTKPLLNSGNISDIFNHFIANKLQEDTKHFQIADESFAPTFYKIQQYYGKLKNSHEPDEIIFSEVSKVFSDNKNNIFDNILSNKPSKALALNNWLYEFARSLWEHHLFQAKKQINNKWQQEIYPTFKRNFDKKYPFTKESTVDATLDDFTNFFGANGKLTNFYEKYISPFYNTKQANWSQITKYNTQLNFSATVQSIFIKSQLIQTMYFSNNKLSVPFHLFPTRIEPIIKKVELIINNHKIIYKHHKKNSLPLEWPFKSQTVHLMFETIHHKQTSDIFNSQWGLFKLLDKAAITPINKYTYQLVFKLAGNSVAFNIDLTKQINPLIKDITGNYQLPEFLFKKELV